MLAEDSAAILDGVLIDTVDGFVDVVCILGVDVFLVIVLEPPGMVDVADIVGLRVVI